MSAAAHRPAAACEGSRRAGAARSPTSSGSAPAGRPNGWCGRTTSRICRASCASSIRRCRCMPVGVGSNLIVRDGGVPGVVVRLPKACATVDVEPGNRVRAGGGAMGITVASQGARRRYRRPRIPARHSRHGRRRGADERRRLWPRGRRHPGRGDSGASRRHASRPGRPSGSATPTATARCPRARSWSRPCSRACPASAAAIGAEMDRIAAEREASQPLRSRTGGSTFKNPPGTKAWKLIDAAGCRGLTHRRRPSL